MFTLDKQPATLASLNTRAEKHGEENVPAADLKISVTGHNALLNSFGPDYRTFLFREPTLGEQPSLLEGDKLTALSKPNLKPLKLDEKFPGYTVRIGTGLDISDDIVLTESDLSNFSIEPINGGSVNITFSVAAHPDEDQVGRLYTLIQHDIEITLERPKAQAEQSPQQDIEQAA